MVANQSAELLCCHVSTFLELKSLGQGCRNTDRVSRLWCCGEQDIEQLLNAHGLHSTGANQLLQNLYKLLAAAASAAPSNSSGRAPSM